MLGIGEMSDEKTGKKDKFVVEKAIAEELPPGWTKELRIRKKGCKIRKDPYYTDPATGYVFRSLKDVQRYLKTGDLGRLAFKPKDNSSDDMELEDEKLPMNAGADGEKLADDGTNGQMTEDQSSKLVEARKDEQIESTSTTKNMCISENASDPCKENAAVINVNPPDSSGSEEGEEKSESTKQMLVPTPLIGTSPENQPLENGLEDRGNKRNKSSAKSKTGSGLPRRASKRLAGVEVEVEFELPPEPKTRRQATNRRPRAAETSTADLATSKEHDEKAEVDNKPCEKRVFAFVLPQVSLSTLEDNVGEVETDIKLKEIQESHIGNARMDSEPSEKQEMPLYLPSADLSTPDEHGGNVEKDNKSNEKQELPTVLPSSNNLSMPKEHAGDVQTDKEEHVAKVEMDNNTSAKQELPIVFPPASLSKPEQFGCSKVETDNNNKPYEKQELPGGVKMNNELKPDSPVNLSLTDLWTDPCIEFAVKTLTGAIPIPTGEAYNKADHDFPGSPLDLPLGELWTDPCIEFAVKTLTGAIPVGGDLCIQDYFQQSSSSSETRGENSLTSPDVGLNNFCQTDHFDTTENSLHKQRVNLQNLGNNALQHHVKGSSGDCSRPTFF